MFEYLREINQKIWDTKYEEAFEALEKYIDHSPRASLEMAFAKVQIGMFTGDAKSRSEVLDHVRHADKLISQYNTSRKNKASYVQQLKDWNKPFESNEAIKTYHDQLDWEYNMNMDHALVSAEGSLLKAIMYYSLNSPLKAGKNIISGYNAFKKLYYDQVEGPQKALEEQNEIGIAAPNTFLPDSKLHGCLHHAIMFGFGVLNYLLSMLPPYVLTILSVFGFESDRERGMDLMHHCAAFDGAIRKGAAQIVLGSPYVFVPSDLQTPKDKNDKLDRYKPLIEAALTAYPQGTMVAYVASQYFTVRGHLDKAVEHMTIAVESARASGYKPMRFSYELGQFLTVNLQFEEAIPVFEEILKHEGDINIRAISCIYLAGCKVLTNGAQDEVVSILRSIPSRLSNHSRIDRVIKEIESNTISSLSEEQMMLMAPILMFEMLFAMRHLYNISENVPLAQQMNKVFTKLSNKILVNKTMNDAKPACSVIRCRLLRSIGEKEKATAILDKLYEQEGKKSLYWSPCQVVVSHVALGEGRNVL